MLDVRYFGFFQYVPYSLMKTCVGFLRRRKRMNVTDTMAVLMKSPPFLINAVLATGFRLEEVLSGIMRMPIGTSLIIAARKQ